MAEDEIAWYPVVGELFSVDPLSPPSPFIESKVTAPPPISGFSKKDLFLTINATTKTTVSSLHPADTNVKLDYLLGFNLEHRSIKLTAARAFAAQILLNAFNDTIIRNTILFLGVEVKSAQTGLLGHEDA